MLLTFLVLISISLGLVGLLSGLTFLLRNTSSTNYSQSATSYECGFEPSTSSRIPFSIRYFLVTLLFLVFDLEISLLLFLPLALNSGFNKPYLLIVSLTFIVALFITLAYEHSSGALDWTL